MVWAAILYAVAGTLSTYRIGRPLVHLDIEQQRREADFRTGLLRVRENAEQIALSKGEAAERRRLMAHFAKVRENWTAIMNRQKRLTFFTAGYNQGQVIVPILAAGPVYFASAISLGGLMQTASAFGRVEGALRSSSRRIRSLPSGSPSSSDSMVSSGASLARHAPARRWRLSRVVLATPSARWLLI
jgi:putative ATP-binding cassette transporter